MTFEGVEVFNYFETDPAKLLTIILPFFGSSRSVEIKSRFYDEIRKWSEDIVLNVTTLKVVLDKDGAVLEEESFEHHGAVILCKGGGHSDNVDAVYNARMTKIYERQQDMAEEYFNFWRTRQRGLDSAKIKAQHELLLYQTDLEKSKSRYGQDRYADMQRAIRETAPVRSKFLSEARNGVNINDRMGKVTADVAQFFENANQQIQRGLSRMGVTPSAGSTASLVNSQNFAKAKATAGARGLTRIASEQENFKRLQADAKPDQVRALVVQQVATMLLGSSKPKKGGLEQTKPSLAQVEK